MAARKRRWSPEQINDMRERLKTASFREVGEVYGVSRETIRLAVGPIERYHPPGPPKGGAERSRQRIAELFHQGKSDPEIARITGLTQSTVRVHRSHLKLRRANKFTEEHARWCLAKWVELFGYVPAATDWNPAQARAVGQERRAIRYDEFQSKFRCPYATTIQKHFGSWSAFTRSSGYPPVGHKLPWRGAPLLSELDHD